MKRPFLLLFAGFTCVGALVPSPAFSQTPGRNPLPLVPLNTPQLFIPGQSPSAEANPNLFFPTPPPPTSQNDDALKNFLAGVGSANERELRLAELAAARSEDPAVRALAQSILREGQADAKALANINGSLGTANTRKVIQREIGETQLSTLTGSEFDAAFLRELRKASAAKVARLRAARQMATSPEFQSALNTAAPLAKADMQSMEATTAGTAQTADSTTPGADPTVSFDPAGRLPSPIGGAPPSAIPGTLPNTSGGNLPSTIGGAPPSAIPGTLPNTAGGNLPSTIGGAPPSAIPGTLPNTSGGNLPSVIGGPPPSPLAGTLPNTSGGNLPSAIGGAPPSIFPISLPNPPAQTLPPPNAQTVPRNNWSPPVFLTSPPVSRSQPAVSPKTAPAPAAPRRR